MTEDEIEEGTEDHDSARGMENHPSKEPSKRIQRDHPINKIIGSTNEGVKTKESQE